MYGIMAHESHGGWGGLWSSIRHHIVHIKHTDTQMSNSEDGGLPVDTYSWLPSGHGRH